MTFLPVAGGDSGWRALTRGVLSSHGRRRVAQACVIASLMALQRVGCRIRVEETLVMVLRDSALWFCMTDKFVRFVFFSVPFYSILLLLRVDNFSSLAS